MLQIAVVLLQFTVVLQIAVVLFMTSFYFISFVIVFLHFKKFRSARSKTGASYLVKILYKYNNDGDVACH